MFKRIASFFLVLLLALPFISQPTKALEGPTVNYEYYDLYFDHMDIKVDVTEEGLVTVNMTIDAVFNRGRHGIQIYLPQRYEMSYTNPETLEKEKRFYHWPVENLRNLSDYPMNRSTQSNQSLRLRFGDPDRYVYGPHTYKYSYQVQTYDLNYKDLHHFYWNIVGTGFEVYTRKVTFELNLPKPVEYPIYVYSGSYYSVTSEHIEYTIENNQTIKGESVRDFPPGTGITLQVDVDEDYFNFPTRPDYSLISLIPLVIGALLSVFWFFRHGRDEQLVITIEHEPPRDLSSAMVGYIYKNSASSKDIISLIIEWASKGYLSINEVEGEEDNMLLTKLQDVPDSMVRFERQFFNKLFDNRDEVETKSLENVFYKYVNQGVVNLSHHFKNKERRLYNAASNVFKGVSLVLAALGLGLFVAINFYNYFYLLQYAGIAFIVTFAVSQLFSLLQMGLFTGFTMKGRFSQMSRIIGSLIFTTIFGVVFYFVMRHIEVLNIYSLVALALYFMIVIAVINMGQRTAYGNDKLGKILGLKTFIEEAEKERLEMLVHDNPKYFYDVLPYAYVLGISDIWSKKFENIAIEPPAGYSGTHFSPIWYTNHMNNMMYHTTQSMTSAPVSVGSGSGGFGGGSFSGGGGGGGFSGGGFGGGGGGGW